LSVFQKKTAIGLTKRGHPALLEQHKNKGLWGIEQKGQVKKHRVGTGNKAATPRSIRVQGISNNFCVG